LKDHDVWEFHPMDQGGRLVQLGLVNSEKDNDMVAALQQPGFFAPWGDPIQWDRLESTELEKSVWLNRWYYLPCFARLYWRTGRRPYLDNLLQIFRQWTKDNPVPADLPGYFRSRKYIWRDMQVAWRTQNLIWCFFMGRQGFTDAEQAELLESIQTHAQVVMAYHGEQALSYGNHQPHGALAILHAAALFPEWPGAEEQQNKALRILNHHLEAAFFADGNSVELCPGYYPFIAANFRDAYLLCVANGIPVSARWKERLRQFHRFLYETQQPDGTTPPINDSTEVPVRVSLQILGDILDLPKSEQAPTTSFRFAESHQAVMRDGRERYLFVDAAAGAGSLFHWHGGKLGFHYWQGGQPCLVDSGICNYDEPLRKFWYHRSSAHNTILVDGLGDTELTKQHSSRASEVGCGLIGWQSSVDFDLATMASTAFLASTSPVSWVRQILMLKRRFVVIVDQLQSDAAHEYRWLFHYTPNTLKADVNRKRLLTGFDDRNLLLAPFQPESFQEMKVGQNQINRFGRNVLAPVSDFVAHAADFRAAFLLLPVDGTEFPGVRLQQALETGGITLDVHTPDASWSLFIPHAFSDAGSDRKITNTAPVTITPTTRGAVKPV